MLELLAAPEMTPFLVALGVMLFIALLEVVGLLFGVAFSGMVDAMLPDIDVPDIDVDLDMDADFDADFSSPDLDAPGVPNSGPFTQFLGWLCVGRVPALVLLVAFLTAFGLSGLFVQSLLKGVTGFYWPSVLAAVPALAAALPLTRYLGLGLAKVMPKVETEAVSRTGFVGKIAVVTRGAARRGLPTEAKLTDRHGQTHYVLVEPDIDDEVLEAGAEVLIVRQTGGAFRAIENTNAALSKQ
ncbi:MAG: YqiJ family protein [Pseudomonadota bacterium]